MVLHLETVFLAATLSSLIIVIGFILIKFLAKGLKGITLWVIAHVCLLLEYGALYLFNDQWQLFLEFLFAVCFRIFLLIGMKLFFDLKISKKNWSIFLLILIAIDISIVFILKIDVMFRYTFSFTIGSLCIYTAILIFQNAKFVKYKEGKRVLMFVGVTFLLSGLHMYDYPLLRPVEWFAPIGYLIEHCFNQAMAVGLFILILQKINYINMKSKEKISQLEGLLPICASCKKIRDVQGYWNQLEEYFLENSEIKFTHGLCDECVRKLYPELNENGS